MGPALLPHHQPPKAPEPGEGPLHHPPLPVARESRLPPAPRPGIPAPGDAGLDAAGPKPSSEGLAVIPRVRHQLLGSCPGPPHRPCHLHMGEKGAVQEGPLPLQPPLLVQDGEEGPEGPLPHPLLLPLSKPPDEL